MTLRFRPTFMRKGDRMRDFGELEQAVMNVVWDADTPLTVREVLERPAPERKPAAQLAVAATNGDTCPLPDAPGAGAPAV